MPDTPSNTYNSGSDLSLAQVPQVDDPEIYDALLDLHNALESLITGNGSSVGNTTAYVTKVRNNTIVNESYIVLETDGTILVDATLATSAIVITLHGVFGLEGFTYNIKRVDTNTAHTVTIVGDGTELIDDRADGIKLSTKSSYTVKATPTGWNII